MFCKSYTFVVIAQHFLEIAVATTRSDTAVEISATGVLRPSHPHFDDYSSEDAREEIQSRIVPSIERHDRHQQVARRQQRKFVLDAEPASNNASWDWGFGADQTPHQEIICNMSVHISERNAGRRCSADCPFLASVETSSGVGCHFMCVASQDCGQIPGLDPNETIADSKKKDQLPHCRKCSIAGCDECDEGGEDKCQKCKVGFHLTSDGKLCKDVYANAWNCVALLFFLIFLFFITWVISLCWRAKGNEEALQRGLEFRSRQKLRVPLPIPGQEATEANDQTEEAPGPASRELFPLSTDIRRDARLAQVAGPGIGLHFSFMWMTCLWGFIVALIWIAAAAPISSELFILGWRTVESKHQFCTVVQTGHRIQERYMWEKATYLFVLYGVSFLLFIGHAVLQKRHFLRVNIETESMRDYAALLMGLPRMTGDAGVEEKVRCAVAEATGEQVVGVSVMWELGEQAGVVASLAERVLNTHAHGEAAFGSLPGSGGSVPAPPIPESTTSGLYGRADGSLKWLLGVDAEESADWSQDPVAEIQKVKGNGAAWAVFENEEARDRAVEKIMSAGGFAMPDADGSGCCVTAEAAGCEPETVRWGDFSLHTWQEIALSLFKGCICILIALFLWAFVFYIPFAYYSVQLASMTGAEDAGWNVATIYFMITVILGNQLMYLACDMVSENVGFRYQDSKMAAYVVLYTLACFINVVLDLAINYGVVLAHLNHIGAHTADGVDLSNLNFQKTFESFPMQEALGKNLFNYTFPACMLLPFLMEPFGLHLCPLQLQSWLVRSDPSLVKDRAERAMAMFTPMDLGRYADCLLNLFLAAAILFFPGGLTLPIFGGLVVSHIYIYCYDKFRVLRFVPGFVYASMEVDACATMMLSGVTALILVCALFKANCARGSPFCYDGMELLGLLAAGGIGHIILHILVLQFVVPLMCKVPHDVARSKYSDVAAVTPCTWFSANPMHCLRSYYIHKHSPPQLFFVRGNEHLLVKNPAIGAHFQDKPAAAEEYGWLVHAEAAAPADSNSASPLLDES